jgi:hypothetical protein
MISNQVARAKYLQLQRHQRQELLQKKLEKESGRIVEEMICGAPKGCALFHRKFTESVLADPPLLVQAQELINFWQQNFRVQVETRSGALRIHEDDECKCSQFWNHPCRCLYIGVRIQTKSYLGPNVRGRRVKRDAHRKKQIHSQVMSQFNSMQRWEWIWIGVLVCC